MTGENVWNDSMVMSYEAHMVPQIDRPLLQSKSAMPFNNKQQDKKDNMIVTIRDDRNESLTELSSKCRVEHPCQVNQDMKIGIS